MIVNSTTCDICGRRVGLDGGAYVDLHRHDAYTVVLDTYPPQYPGRFDLCDECRDALSAWIGERREEALNDGW